MRTFNKTMMLILVLFISITSLTGFKSNSILPELITEKDKKSTVIEGLYVLETCENGRFKIKIDKKDSTYTFRILDGEKSISKGKVTVTIDDKTTYLAFGEIEGVLNGSSIQIQNYGNSMNEYNHFTQCAEKYLTFKKNK